MYFKTIALTCLVAFGSAVSVASAQGQLNMICGTPQPVCDSIIAEFSQETGINVNFIRLSAGEAYAKIRAEARNPKVDIWFGGTHEPHYQAAEEGLTQPYQSPQLDNLHPLAQKLAQETDYKSNAHALIAIGFTWNTQVLQEKGLPEPHSWADLLRPEYKGEIAVSNPNTAGTGYSILVTLVDLMGEDAAFDYLKKLNANVSSYTKSGGAVSSQVARGETAIGLTFVHDANILISQGFPLKTTYPSEGTGYALDSVALIKGARNLEQAKTFVDWILTPQAQSLNIKNGLNSYPTAIGTTLSEYTADIAGVKLLELDQRFYGLPETRKKLLSRWDREIGAIAGQ